MRRASRIEEDEVVSDRNQTLLLCSFPIAFFSAGFREACAASRNARVLPATPSLYPPFRTQTIRHRHLFAGLFGCNRSHILFVCFSFVYIYTRSCLCCLSLHSRLRCRRVVSLCFFAHTHATLSLSFPLLSSTLRFKTPVVPPRFSTHARSNVTYLVNPT